MTQSDLLLLVGEVLYGPDAPWGQRMATALDVNRRTIQRWMDHTEMIPGGVLRELGDLVAGRIIQAHDAHRALVQFRAPLLKEAPDV